MSGDELAREKIEALRDSFRRGWVVTNREFDTLCNMALRALPPPAGQVDERVRDSVFDLRQFADDLSDRFQEEAAQVVKSGADLLESTAARLAEAERQLGNHIQAAARRGGDLIRIRAAHPDWPDECMKIIAGLLDDLDATRTSRAGTTGEGI